MAQSWQEHRCFSGMANLSLSARHIMMIKYLTRKDQSTVFRLRRQRIQFNSDLNRICWQQIRECQLFSYAYETVDHQLFECKSLDDIKNHLSPSRPNKLNKLNGGWRKLEKICKFNFFFGIGSKDAQLQLLTAVTTTATTRTTTTKTTTTTITLRILQ